MYNIYCIYLLNINYADTDYLRENYLNKIKINQNHSATWTQSDKGNELSICTSRYQPLRNPQQSSTNLDI